MVKKNIRKDKNNFLESLNLNLFNNKSGKKSYNGILIIAGILGVMFLMGFVFAGNLGNSLIVFSSSSTGTLNQTINEDVSRLFNVSINYSGQGIATNITQVNITIPSSFTFTSNTNGTSAANGTTNATGFPVNHSFSNTATVLTWNATALILNGTQGMNNVSFWFNLTATNPGNYTINIAISNSTYTDNNNSLNVTVNDTTAPHVVFFNTGTPVNRANLSVREIIVNVSANDTFSAIGSFNISLLFPNGSIANNTLHKGANLEVNGSVWVNFTGAHLTDGQYIINVSNVSDNAYLRGFGANNTNMTGITRNITIDLTAPTITLTKSASSTAHQVVIDVALSDATSGIVGKQCSATSTGSGTVAISGTGGSQTATQTGLGCSTDYTYTVTCTDYSGNSRSTQAVVSTDGCTGGGGTSGTSSGTSGSDVVGSASSAFWILTYNEASTDLSDDSDGVSVNLAERYRAKVKVDTKLYYIGIVDTTDTTAKINVTTTASDKEATLNVGDVKKFDVNADDKYDLSVTLNGVDSATGKADLSVVYIQEPVSAEEQAGVEEQAGTEATTPTATGKSKAWIWVVVAIVVLGIIGAIVFGRKNSRHKNYGF